MSMHSVAHPMSARLLSVDLFFKFFDTAPDYMYYSKILIN